MAAFRHRMIHAGLQVLQGTRLHRLAAPLTRGRGAILTFHQVTGEGGDGFAPNRLLAITPDFLDAALRQVRRLGYRIVPLDAVPSLLGAKERREPFVALTFDDGYRDLLDEALPVLDAHAAPFTAFVTTGFLDRTARLWWLELETLIRRRSSLEIAIDGRSRVFGLESVGAKERAFATIARFLIERDDGQGLAAVLEQCRQKRISGYDLVDRLCLDWDELVHLAAHPLATIGCHTASHPRLAGLDVAALGQELDESRRVIADRIGRPVEHLCYPYGGRSAAAAREFRAAVDLGFATAVTTRPGVLVAAHRRHVTALPRISVNGLWQSAGALDILLSGAGFALWNRGRRLDVA